MDRKLVRMAAVVGAAILLAAAVMVYFFVYAGSPQIEIGEVITPAPTAEETAAPEPTPEPTVAPAEIPEQTPTAEPEKLTETPEAAETEEAPECDYVLNKKSMKIHYPWCSGVVQMKESNKIYFTGTIDDARAQGYESCGTCKPN